ncbi:MAG: hypothetical protein AAF769_00415 [Pseudomonadota bacterium]
MRSEPERKREREDGDVPEIDGYPLEVHGGRQLTAPNSRAQTQEGRGEPGAPRPF